MKEYWIIKQLIKSRLPIFINKPAPVQITWAGYLDTTGLKEIDYIIADPFVVDKEQESLFVEKVWKLPDIWNSFSQPNYPHKIQTYLILSIELVKNWASL